MIDLSTLPLRQPERIRKDTVIWGTASKYREVISKGTMLCVDPSIGSHSSMPGYAVYVEGQLMDSGIIRLPTSGDHIRRLYELNRSLREDFSEQVYDILVIEEIPMVRYEKFGRSLQAQIPLHRAVGCVLGALPIGVCLEIPPQTWRMYLDVAQYDKNDESDAVMLGYAALQLAKAASEYTPRSKKK